MIVAAVSFFLLLFLSLRRAVEMWKTSHADQALATNIPIDHSMVNRRHSSQGKLYYLATDGNIMAVEIKPGTHFEYGSPKALFPARIFRDSNMRFEVSSDGRFLLSAPVEQEASAPMNVELNWPAELKR